MSNPVNVGEQFANLTGQIEDAHGIALEGQRHGLSRDEARVLVQQVRCQLARTALTCQQIISS